MFFYFFYEELRFRIGQRRHRDDDDDRGGRVLSSFCTAAFRIVECVGGNTRNVLFDVNMNQCRLADNGFFKINIFSKLKYRQIVYLNFVKLIFIQRKMYR